RAARADPPACRRRAAPRDSRRSRRRGSTAELELVPRRHGSELEQRPVAVRIAVGEVRELLVPGDVEDALLDTVVEPGAPEHELLQPIDEGLPAHEGDAFP